VAKTTLSNTQMMRAWMLAMKVLIKTIKIRTQLTPKVKLPIVQWLKPRPPNNRLVLSRKKLRVKKNARKENTKERVARRRSRSLRRRRPCTQARTLRTVKKYN
jgi:hypothetical protein